MKKYTGFSLIEMMIVMLMMSITLMSMIPVLTVRRISVAQAANAVTPIGSITAYSSSTQIPNGWFKCSGQAISRGTYSILFGLIGITYGAGDGSTTFNLPDLRGEFIRGLSEGRSGIDVGRNLGSWESEDFTSHTHSGSTSSYSHSHGGWTGTMNQNQTHYHIQGMSDWNSYRNHIYGGTSVGSAKNIATTDDTSDFYPYTNTVNLDHQHSIPNDTHTHTLTINPAAGAGGGIETRPRNIALVYIIRAK